MAKKKRAAGPPSERDVQKQLDAVLMADAPRAAADATSSTRAPIGAGRRPVPPIGSIGAGPGGAGYMAAAQPVEIPTPSDQPTLVKPEEQQATFGLPGTPITSAFLLDLAEYNPLLQGRAAVPTYEKIRRSDDMAWAVLNVWRLPVMSAKWDVVEPDRKNGPARKTGSNGAGRTTQAKAKEVTAFVRDNLFGGLEFQTSTGAWSSQQWQSVIYNATLMLDFGCSVHEEIFRVDGNRIRLRALQQRQAITFYRWHTEEDGETLKAMEQYGYRGNAYLNVTLPVERMCRFTYRQEGANFFGIPLSRALYSPWFYKDRLKRIAAVAAEKNMLGIPIWKLAKGFSPEEKAEALRTVTQICAHELTGLVEPPAADANDKSGFRFETPAAQGRQALAGLLQWVAYYDISMARAALAMFIQSGNTPFGNRSTTKEHADFFLLAAQSLADQIRWELQVNTVRRLVWFNFGADAPVPDLIAANVQARQLEDMVSLLKDLGAAGLVVSDQSIRDWLRKEIAAPDETRDGLVANRGETIDVGEAQPGQEIGRTAPPGGAPPDGPPKPGSAPPPDQKTMREGLFYHLLPEQGSAPEIDRLKVGDEFKLDRPVLFGRRLEPSNGRGDDRALRASEAEFARAANRGRLLLVRETWSSNDWLKGKFRVRTADAAGNIQVEHVNERTGG